MEKLLCKLSRIALKLLKSGICQGSTIAEKREFLNLVFANLLAFPFDKMQEIANYPNCGGERGIRTLDTV